MKVASIFAANFWLLIRCVEPFIPMRSAVARSILLFAKPAANLSFDLEAIEALEAELDAKAAISDVDARSPAASIEVDCSGGPEATRSRDTLIHIVPSEMAGKRIDAVIAKLEPHLSRSFCGSLVRDKRVNLIGKDSSRELIDRKSFKVEPGQTIEISMPQEEKPTENLAQDLPLNIIFEDEHIIVINKAADMVVHPAAGNWDGTVVNALSFYLANRSPFGSGDFFDDDGKVRSSEEPGDFELEGTERETSTVRPGIVHRLDKGTTGILVVAKTSQALAALSDSFANREVKKTYLAITVGNPGKRVVIDKPIGRHPRDRQRMRVVPDPHKKDSSRMAPKDRLVENRSPAQAGRRALSFVDTVSFDGKLSLAQVRIETGRTHQIRVHLQDRHTPIYGDEVYGLSDWNKKLSKTHQISRPLLHAHRLEVKHPITGINMVFKAGLAEDMMSLVKAIYPQAKEERPDLFDNNSVD